MKPKTREQLDSYYEQAQSWSQDRARGLEASRKWAIIAAAIFAFVAIAEAIALVVLLPLKTVEPYTLLVDKQTGYVEALKPIDGAVRTPDEALTRSFLVQYVLARENFNINTLQREYGKVALWSEGTARTRYIASMQASNPQSPLSRLPRGTIVTAEIRSISMLSPSSAMVRYGLRREDQNGRVQDLGNRVSILRWKYSGQPMSVEDRLINPLGFKVTRYSTDVESLPINEPVSNGVANEEIENPQLPPDPLEARARRLRDQGQAADTPVRRP